ncbi:MAG: RluA family pseudouridine synthase [Defluviitaleaceae bacterium]|nr:RluA family pseudouridine synthase [Defluviitaleaceae bacterium]
MITITAESVNKRIDILLTEKIEGLSRNNAQRLLEDGQVTIGGQPIKKNARLKLGDIVVCIVPSPAPYTAVAEDIPLDIIYEDNDIIVINKPRGLVVHPAAGHFNGTLVNALLHHCGESLSGIGGVQRPGIVHRLDKDTSGLMVVAKNDEAHQGLSNQLSSRKMGRVYQALCVGRIKSDNQRIDIPIGRHPKDRKKMAVITTGKSREAVTNISVLERFSRFTLIEARLETGRTHQIRVHLSYLGHPVLGDPLYGPKKQPLGLESQILHAKALSLVHPITGETMNFETPLPDYFTEALNKSKLMK